MKTIFGRLFSEQFMNAAMPFMNRTLMKRWAEPIYQTAHQWAFMNLNPFRLPGSLAHTNVVGNMLFGSISGSSVAAAAAIGGVMSPLQEKEGYDRTYSAAKQSKTRESRIEKYTQQILDGKGLND